VSCKLTSLKPLNFTNISLPGRLFDALYVFVGCSIVLSLSSPALASLELLIAEAKDSVVVIESSSSQGSGVLIDSSGVIVTNLHVLENATDLSVKTHNGEKFDDVDVIDFDEAKDIALIKIKGFDLPYAVLGNSNKVRSGQDVFAIGAPQGLEQTVSRGIVSAVRMMDGGFNAIQTDAAISSGSSGGGLFNVKGELVGILTAYRSDGQNLNFAVPVNYARGMYGQPVRYTEEEFLVLNARTPNFGEKLENAESSGKLERWLNQLDDEYDDLKYSASEKNKYGVMISDFLITINLYDDLLWIAMRVGDERALTEMQLRKLLSLSLELDYAYISLDEDQVLANSELHLPGSDYSSFRKAFLSVLAAYVRVTDDEDLSSDKANSNNVRADQIDTLPAVMELSDRSGLRELNPSGLGVYIGFRAFQWGHSEQQGGVTFTSKRGSNRYAKLFVEELEYQVSEAETVLTSTMDAYLEAMTGLDNVEKIEFGFRDVQGLGSISFRYSGFSGGIKYYWYTTLVLDGKHMVTLHTWDLDADWKSMEEVTKEFLSAVRFL